MSCFYVQLLLFAIPMARIKLDIPDTLPFITEMAVRITDVNYGNHLANDALLGMLHEARMRFLKYYGYSEMNMEGVSMIMADSAIVYRGEAFFGDILQVSVGPADFSNKGFDFLYRMVCPQAQRQIALAKTGMVCFDYKTRKPQPLPQAFRERFE